MNIVASSWQRHQRGCLKLPGVTRGGAQQLPVCADSCPVRCIHWVERDELPVLEHVMASIPRIAVCNLQNSDRKGSGGNVFSLAEAFKKKKREGRVARKSWTEVRFQMLHTGSHSLLAVLALSSTRPSPQISRCCVQWSLVNSGCSCLRGRGSDCDTFLEACNAPVCVHAALITCM